MEQQTRMMAQDWQVFVANAKRVRQVNPDMNWAQLEARLGCKRSRIRRALESP